MKLGDLVQMRQRVFWMAKGNPYLTYTSLTGIIIEVRESMLSVLYSDGKIKYNLAEYFEVLNESR